MVIKCTVRELDQSGQSELTIHKIIRVPETTEVKVQQEPDRDTKTPC